MSMIEGLELLSPAAPPSPPTGPTPKAEEPLKPEIQFPELEPLGQAPEEATSEAPTTRSAAPDPSLEPISQEPEGSQKGKSFNMVNRVMAQYAAIPKMASWMAGGADSREVVANINALEDEREKYGRSEEDEAALQAFQQEATAPEGAGVIKQIATPLRAIPRNLGAAGSLMLESAATSVPSMGVGLLGGLGTAAITKNPSAAIKGGMAAAAGTEAALEAADALIGYLRDKGIDPRKDPEGAVRFLDLNQAEARAIVGKDAAIVGALSYYGSKAGSWISDGVFREGVSTLGRAGFAAAGATTESAISEGVASLGQDVTSGKPPDVSKATLETALGVGQGLPAALLPSGARAATGTGTAKKPPTATEPGKEDLGRVRDIFADTQTDSGTERNPDPPGTQQEIVGLSQRIDSIVDRMIHNESSGNPTAQNPLSSARGLGQFTRGTWLDVMRRNMPGLIEEMGGPMGALTLRDNPVISRLMTKAYALENAKILEDGGYGATPTNIYLAHHFGPMGALRILGEDPHVPVENVLSAGEMRANPYLQGMTVGRLRYTIASKMDEDPDAGWEPQKVPLYSGVEKAVRDAKPTFALGGDWVNLVSRTPGVKKEELDLMGLQTSVDPKRKYSKEEMLQKVRENSIEIREIVLKGEEIQYGAYLLEGGDESEARPREFILLAPASEDPKKNYYAPHFQEANRQVGPGSAQRTSYDGSDYNDYEGDEDAPYSVPNIIATVRVTRRRDSLGRNTLLIEEVQSDWHQAGAKVGYKKPSATESDIRNERLKALRIDLAAAREAQAWDVVEDILDKIDTTNDGGQYLEDMPVPEGPFSDTWRDLAIKRMVKFAVDNGYDSISLATPEVQKERYPGDAKRDAGFDYTYGKILPGLLKGYARKLGGVIETIQVPYTAVMYQAHDPNGDPIGGPTRNSWDAEEIAVDAYMRIPGWSASTTDQENYDAVRDAQRYAIEAGYTFDLVNIPKVVETISLRITPEMRVLAQEGMPLFAIEPPNSRGKVELEQRFWEGNSNAIQKKHEESYAILAQAAEVARLISKRLGIPAIKVVAVGGPWQKGTPLGLYYHTSNTIVMNLGQMMDQPVAVWSTFMHEFGHAVMYQLFNKLPDAEQLNIYGAWEKWVEEKLDLPEGTGQLLDKRKPFASAQALGLNPMSPRGEHVAQDTYNLYRSGNVDPNQETTYNDKQKEYFLSFHEWFAEQVSRWATGGERPMTVAEIVFSKFAKILRDLMQKFHERFGVPFEPNSAVRDWLDSYLRDVPPWGEVEKAQRDFMTRQQNQRAIAANGEGSRAEPAQLAMAPVKDAVGKLFHGEGGMPKEVKAAAAHADTMSKWHYYMTSIYMVASRNPYLQPLQMYVQKVKLAVQEMNQMLSEGSETIKAWRSLGSKEADKLTAFLTDYGRMSWLTQEERNRKVVRKPTEKEALDLLARHKIDVGSPEQPSPTMDAIERLIGNERKFAETQDPRYRGDFGRVLDRYFKTVSDMLKRRIQDPELLGKKLAALAKNYEDLRKQPFVPTLNFGQWAIRVMDGNGNITKFYTFRTKMERARAIGTIRKDLDPFLEETIQEDFVTNESLQFLGMPRAFLEAIQEYLPDVTESQASELEKLKLMRQPYQGWEARFLMRKGVEGYSTNFMRAYSHFMFHAATHLTRMKYKDDLEQHVLETYQASEGMTNATKRGQIRWMMEDHLREFLTPSREWAWLTGFTFMFHLGFNVASAMVNIFQVPTSAWPYISAKYGLGTTEAAMIRAAVDWKRYYTRGSLGNRTESTYKAISEGIERGIITEALGPEVAGMAADRNVMDRLGTNPATRGAKWVLDKGGYLFGLSEQAGRRLTFSAVWDLSQKNQEPKGWKEILLQHKLLYEDLMTQGWSDKDARSFVFATDAVEKSFYIYNRTARPKFMRGIGRPLFAFKTFLLNELFMTSGIFTGKDRDIALRKIAVWMGLVGLMGVPGSEDIEDLIQAGFVPGVPKGASLERYIREEITQLFDGTIDPDLVLHGLSKRGFGVPHLMGLLGLEHFPELDMSTQVGIGNISPVQMSPFFAPQVDPQQAQMRGLERAGGASFGLGFRLIKFIEALNEGGPSLKAAEHLLPKAMNNVSQAYRVWRDEGILLNNGAKIIPYDLDNVQHMTELGARALGFQNLRTTATWDYRRDLMQQEATVELTRQQLLNQHWEAMRTGDTELAKGIREGIKEWNNSLPDMWKGKAIGGDTLKRSTKVRAKNQRMIEQGIEPQKSNRPASEALRRLHPNAEFLGSRTVK